MADIDAVDGNRLPFNYNKKETEPLSTQWEGRPALTFSPAAAQFLQGKEFPFTAFRPTGGKAS